MEVKEEKRPIWGIDKYLHFVVLGLSCLNLVQLTPNLIGSLNLNGAGSILLSFVGILAYPQEEKWRGINNFYLVDSSINYFHKPTIFHHRFISRIFITYWDDV